MSIQPIECLNLLNLQQNRIGVDVVLTTGLRTVTKEIIIEWFGCQDHEWCIPLILNNKFTIKI